MDSELLNSCLTYAPAGIDELPPGMPAEVARNTLLAAEHLLKAPPISLADLRDPRNFRTLSQWSAYWLVSHAAQAAAAFAQYGNENGCSNALLNRLQVGTSEQRHFLGEQANGWALGHIGLFNFRKHAIQEGQFGADILLVMAGEDLIGTHGAKLLWIQGKRAPDNSPCTLDFHHQDTMGNVQVEKLWRAKDESAGSFALFALYAMAHPYVLSVDVRVARDAWREKREKSIDICRTATRIQEHVFAIVRKNSNSMKQPKDVLHFLSNRQERGIIPLSVATLAGVDHG